ncbi:hypothetical protein RDABS01_006007 [Bienertia sinuspersici]
MEQRIWDEGSNNSKNFDLCIIIWVLIQQEKLSRNKELSSFEKESGFPAKFQYEELVLATDNFCSIVGQGGSGCVFKGTLEGWTCIAVKRMEGQGRERENSELKLLQLGPRFLVYEFVQNGSLDRWIFPREQKENQQPGGCLSWNLRLQVAIDVARALAYLHDDCQSRIMHLDVKPENILLDDNYRALCQTLGWLS